MASVRLLVLNRRPHVPLVDIQNNRCMKVFSEKIYLIGIEVIACRKKNEPVCREAEGNGINVERGIPAVLLRSVPNGMVPENRHHSVRQTLVKRPVLFVL